MSDPTVSSDSTGDLRRRWLLLTHYLPTEPAYFRVKVRRRLERIGAVALKNSVYVLPMGDDTREDFEWLAEEIERNGGEASLCEAVFVDGVSDDRLAAAFAEARTADYREIEEATAELSRKAEGGDDAAASATRVAQLRKRLERVVEIDFFTAPGRRAAESGLEALSRADRVSGPPDALSGARPTGRTWVTREGVKVDRIASAWLIRRFIDADATFRFVPSRGYRPREGELRFDMFGGEYTHVGESCTFETLVDRFGLDDPALATLGAIVHDIDVKDDKFGREETEGVAATIAGIVASTSDDALRLERGWAVLDGLYQHFRGRA